MSVVKVSRSALRAQQLVEAGLVDRRSRRARAPRPSRARMSRAIDRVAELGEAGGGDQPDPADPDHPDRLSLLAHLLRSSLVSASGSASITFAERAMPDHLVVGQRLQQVVGDPVGVVAAVPGDQLDPVAVDEDVVFAAVDRLGFGSGRRGSAGRPSPGSPARRSSGCRRAVRAIADHPVGAVAVAVGVLEVVDARILDVFVGIGFDVGGARGQPRRVEDREAAADLAGDDLRLELRRLRRPGTRPSLAGRLRLRAVGFFCFFFAFFLPPLLLAAFGSAFERAARAAARFDAEELFDRAFDRFRRGVDVARARVRPGSGPR